MKKWLKHVLLLTVLVIALAVPTFAADPIDTSALTTGFADGIGSTVTMILALLPIGLTLFSVMFAAKKAISFFKGMA